MLTDDLVDNETSEGEELKTDLVKRRNLGKKGNPITVTLNYVYISLTDPSSYIYHYNVHMEPEPSRLKLCRYESLK